MLKLLIRISVVVSVALLTGYFFLGVFELFLLDAPIVQFLVAFITMVAWAVVMMFVLAVAFKPWRHLWGER